MEFLRKAVRIGNSSGVILPKKLLGAEVKVIVVNKPVDFEKDALKLLSPVLDDILGIYKTTEKPAEVLAISSETRDTIESDILKINIVPLSMIKRDIKTNLLLRQKIIKSETLINPMLLEELKKEIRSLPQLNSKKPDVRTKL